MRGFKLATHLILLATTPSMLVYPDETLWRVPEVSIPTALAGKLGKNFKKKDRYHLVTYDEILNLLAEIESGEAEKKYKEKDLDKINDFLVYLAQKGVLPSGGDALALNEDIGTLLADENEYEYAVSFGEGYAFATSEQGEVVLCGGVSKAWKKTKKFVKKHKKEIIIGAVVVVATVAIVVAVTAVSAGAASTAAGSAVGAAGAAASGKDGSKREHKAPSETTTVTSVMEAVEEAPHLQAAINEQMDAFKEVMVTNHSAQAPNSPSQEWTDFSFGETAREWGASVCHQVYEGVSKAVDFAPRFFDEVKDLTDKIFPNAPSYSDSNFVGSREEDYKNRIANGHNAIDKAFATDQAEAFAAGAGEVSEQFAVGIIPPPGSFSKGVNISKFKESIRSGEKAAAIAEELGFTRHEIVQLEKTGQLDSAVSSAIDKIYSNQAMLESAQKFKYAQRFLQPYGGQYLPEARVRELIHQTGVQTFPRPDGIPKSFRVKLSGKGAGMKYVHPNNEQTYIRVMPGKPHSPHPYQRKPYITQMKDGKTLDKFGKRVEAESAEAHIPVKEFKYLTEK